MLQKPADCGDFSGFVRSFFRAMVPWNRSLTPSKGKFSKQIAKHQAAGFASCTVWSDDSLPSTGVALWYAIGSMKNHDSKTRHWWLPPLFAKKGQSRQTTQSRHICHAGGRQKARTRGSILQATLNPRSSESNAMKARTRTARFKGKTSKRRPSSKRYWSQPVTLYSDALTLEPQVFAFENPHRIATSLKRSAVSSKRRKGTPFQSAMSMLNFYINRAGRKLSPKQRKVLTTAKGELRKVFGRMANVPQSVIK